MTSIGIVGAGISGLHLALRLQQKGVHTVVYSPQTIEDLQAGRPRNFPARFGRTQDREDELGVHHWRFPDAQTQSWSISLRAEAELGFRAELTPPSSVVDFRLYLPTLMADYVERGGQIVFDGGLPKSHDLVVVAAGGKGPLTKLFPRDPDRSPYTEPQRVICAGLYRGIREETPHSLDFYFLPGIGEILRIPFYTRSGRVDVLGFEAVPDGPMASIAHADSDDKDAFHREVLAMVATHAPALRARIDDREFTLDGPGELAQGAITPVVREGWADLGDGRFALAIGDAWILNDPIAAQGANLGSRTAFALANLLATTEPPYDERFCRDTSARLWEQAAPVVNLSNAMLAPPPPQLLRVFGEAAADPRVATAFVNNFNDPDAMWRALATPEGTEEFLTTCRRPVPQDS
jgi:2-polyprenyl-6-methoxyphenol hydroxylase-like FAD-dependent oxidoreductase